MATRNLTDRVLETTGGYTLIETPSCNYCQKKGSVALTAAEIADLEAGAAIQDAAPRLARDVREQFISGFHPACWEELFGLLPY